MSLKKETIDLLNSLGIEYEKLKTAIAAPSEVDFKIPIGKFYSDEDITVRDKNIIAEAKPAIIEETKKAAFEISAKQIANGLGIADKLKDKKDLTEVINVAKEYLQAGDPILKEQINLLQSDLKKKTTEIETIVKEKENILFDSNLKNWLPKNKHSALTDEEHLGRVKKELTFENIEGQLVVKRNGEIMRDATTRKPIEPQKAIESVYIEKNWVENAQGQPQGRGGQGSQGVKQLFSNAAEALEFYTKENPNSKPSEHMAFLEQCAKDNSDFKV
jgi:hypothetical protein